VAAAAAQQDMVAEVVVVLLPFCLTPRLDGAPRIFDRRSQLGPLFNPYVVHAHGVTEGVKRGAREINPGPPVERHVCFTFSPRDTAPLLISTTSHQLAEAGRPAWLAPPAPPGHTGRPAPCGL